MGCLAAVSVNAALEIGATLVVTGRQVEGRRGRGRGQGELLAAAARPAVHAFAMAEALGVAARLLLVAAEQVWALAALGGSAALEIGGAKGGSGEEKWHWRRRRRLLLSGWWGRRRGRRLRQTEQAQVSTERRDTGSKVMSAGAPKARRTSHLSSARRSCLWGCTERSRQCSSRSTPSASGFGSSACPRSSRSRQSTPYRPGQDCTPGGATQQEAAAAKVAATHARR